MREIETGVEGRGWAEPYKKTGVEGYLIDTSISQKRRPAYIQVGHRENRPICPKRCYRIASVSMSEKTTY